MREAILNRVPQFCSAVAVITSPSPCNTPLLFFDCVLENASACCEGYTPPPFSSSDTPVLHKHPGVMQLQPPEASMQTASFLFFPSETERICFCSKLSETQGGLQPILQRWKTKAGTKRKLCQDLIVMLVGETGVTRLCIKMKARMRGAELMKML